MEHGLRNLSIVVVYIVEGMTSRALLRFSILTVFWLLSIDSKLIHLMTIEMLIFTFISIIRYIITKMMPF